jgi:peptide/nickel transport system substrate-binding protein/oligopeptide transport system substrate-binding protein
MKASHISALALVLLVLGWQLPGCGAREESPRRPSASPDAPRGGTLRIIHQEPGTLDPLYVDDVYEGTITNQVFEGLLALDETCNLQPHLAEKWTISADGREYVFSLRPGVRFSDGTPLSAVDVVVTFACLLSPKRHSDSFAATYLEGIEGARAFEEGLADWPSGLEVLDSLTLRVRLEEPLATFLSALTMDQARIVAWRDRLELIPGGLETLRRHLPNRLLPRGEPPEPSGGLAPLGTGPFYPVSWERDVHVTLARNPWYWADPPGVDTLRFLTKQSWQADEIVQLFVDRQAEVAPVPRGRRRELEMKAGARIDVSPELTFSFIGLRLDHPPFDELLFRQALAYAIDVEKLAALDSGLVRPATGILPPGMPGYQPVPARLPFDPDAARDALAALGYGPDNPAPPCTLYTTPSMDPRKEFESSLKEDLAAVGIPLVVEYMEWTELDQATLRGELGMFLLGWVADIPDPDSIFHFLFHSQGSSNLFAFSDPLVDRLIEKARRTRGAERWEIYRKLESLILSQVPIIPLRNPSDMTAWQPYVVGVRHSPLGVATLALDRVRLLPRDDRLAAWERVEGRR